MDRVRTARISPQVQPHRNQETSRRIPNQTVNPTRPSPTPNQRTVKMFPHPTAEPAKPTVLACVAGNRQHLSLMKKSPATASRAGRRLLCPPSRRNPLLPRLQGQCN
jgi:hypothetical protein